MFCSCATGKVDEIIGWASFVDKNTIAVNEELYRADKFVIAVGMYGWALLAGRTRHGRPDS